MLCPWCSHGQILPQKPVAEHLVILEFDDGTSHVHYPVENDEALMRLLTYLGNERQKTDESLSSISPAKPE